MTCSVDECPKPAARGGLCWTHVKRRQRQKPLSEPVREYGLPLRERLAMAAQRYADAPDDEHRFKLLMVYLRREARRYARTIVHKAPESVSKG